MQPIAVSGHHMGGAPEAWSEVHRQLDVVRGSTPFVG
jgi:hypothetical protein